jgi:trimeric autotransporter adhesin
MEQLQQNKPPPLPPKSASLAAQSQVAPPPVPPKPRMLQPDVAQSTSKLPLGEQCSTADTSPSLSPCSSTDSSSPFHEAIHERLAVPPPVPPRKHSSTPAVEQFELQKVASVEVLFPHWPVPDVLPTTDFTANAATAAADEALSPLRAARSRTTSEAVSVGDPFADWCSDLSPVSDAAELARTAQWEPEAVENTTAEAAAAPEAAEIEHQDADDVIDLTFPSAEEITSIAATASCLSSPTTTISASGSRQFDSGHGFSAGWAGSGHGVTALARPKSVRFATGAAAAVPAASDDAASAAASLSPVHYAVSEMLDAAIVRAAVAVTHNAAIKHTRAKSAGIEAAFLPVAGDSLLTVAAVSSIVNELVADILAASATAAQLKLTASQAVPAAVVAGELVAPTVERITTAAAVVPPAVAAEAAPDVAESWAVGDVFSAPDSAVSVNTAWKPDKEVAADESFSNFFSTAAAANVTTSSLKESAGSEQQWNLVTGFEETSFAKPAATFSAAAAADFSAFGSNSSTQFSFARAADEHKDSTFITSTKTAATVTWGLPVVAATGAADTADDVVNDVFDDSSKALNSTASEFVAAVTAAAVTAAAVSIGRSETTVAPTAATTESDAANTVDTTVSSITDSVADEQLTEQKPVIESDDSVVQQPDATVRVSTDAVTTAVSVFDEPQQTAAVEPNVQEDSEVLADNREAAAVLAAEVAEVEVSIRVPAETAAVEPAVVEVAAEPEVEQVYIEEPAASAVETAAAAVTSVAAAVDVAHSDAPPAAVVTESDMAFDAEPSQSSTVEMVTNRMTTHRSSFAGSTTAVAAPVAVAAAATAAAPVVPAVKSYQAAPWLAPPAPASPEAATADAATAARVAAAAAAATAAAIAVNEAAGVRRSRPSTRSNRGAAATSAATATAAVNSVKTKAAAFVSTTRGLLQKPLNMAKAVAAVAAPGRKQQQQQQQQQQPSAARAVNGGATNSSDADVSAAEGGYPESEYDDVQVDDEEDVDIGKFGFCGLRVSRSPSPSRSPSHSQQQR